MSLTFDYGKLSYDMKRFRGLGKPKKKKVNVKIKPKKQKNNCKPKIVPNDVELIKHNSSREPSEMEIKIAEFLESISISFVKEYHHGSLRNPKTKNLLFIDFYIPQYKIAIEYDGKHHYIDEDKDRLTYQKYKDRIKSKWCKDNKVKLLRIPYTEQHKYALLISNFLKKES